MASLDESVVLTGCFLILHCLIFQSEKSKLCQSMASCSQTLPFWTLNIERRSLDWHMSLDSELLAPSVVTSVPGLSCTIGVKFVSTVDVGKLSIMLKRKKITGFPSLEKYLTGTGDFCNKLQSCFLFSLGL